VVVDCLVRALLTSLQWGCVGEGMNTASRAAEEAPPLFTLTGSKLLLQAAAAALLVGKMAALQACAVSESLVAVEATPLQWAR
jgi:hypothetical protein